YIRHHEQDLLALLGPDQTRDTLPEITPRPPRSPRAPRSPRSLKDKDWRLIGSALKHPTATITQLAEANNWPDASLWKAYVALGPKLNTGGTGTEVFKYIRDHEQDVLALLGPDQTRDTLPEITPRPPRSPRPPRAPRSPRSLKDKDWRLIGSVLKHPTATITQLANANHWQHSTLQKAYKALGHQLNTGGSANDVVDYIRNHEQDVLALLGPDQTRDTLPEITPHAPRPPRSLKDKDWRLIGSVLKHPTATITQLAEANHWQHSTLYNAYLELGPRLNTGGTGTEVFKYIRDHEQDLLALLGPDQTRDTLPEITPRPARPTSR
ncbi:hypothetical protein, partial [Streptomyces chartreusis]